MLLEDMLYDDYFDIYCSVREGGLSNIVTLLITSRFFVRQGYICSNVVKCCQCCQILSNIVNCFQILSNIVTLLITAHFFVKQGCIYVVVSRKFKFAANFARKLIPITFYYSCKNLSDFPIITLITSHFFARQGCIYLQMWAISTFLL